MFSSALDLTVVYWQAEQSDGKIINEGPQKYQTINRKLLESFSLKFKKKEILSIRVGERVLVARRKTWNQIKVISGENKILSRFWIVALLCKAKSKATIQHVECEFDPNWNHQFYDIDTEESNIYYVFENGKNEIRTRFGHTSPYAPLHLRPEEYLQLMGKEDPTTHR